MRTKLLIFLALAFATTSAFATQITPKFISSGAATDGFVLTADGSGNAAFEVLPGASTPIQEYTTGTINGSNTLFSISQTPVAAAEVMLYLDGMLLVQGVSEDYTISGTSITMVTAPATDQKLFAVYRY